MSVYPKWLYHAENQPRVVGSAEEHAALGDGWHESPADIAPPQGKPASAEEAEAQASVKPKQRKAKEQKA